VIWSPFSSPRAAIAVLLLSAALAAWEAYDAFVIAPMPRKERSPSRNVAVPRPTAGSSSARLANAVQAAPFRPQRKAPTQRFRLPGDSAVALKEPSLEPGADFRLIGTAIMAEGRGFAMCQLGAEPPRLVRIGDRIGEMTLRRVGQGRATFADAAGRRIELQVPKAGS
jgi:hypothetical protein